MTEADETTGAGHPVVVTGLGAVSALGTGCGVLVEALEQGIGGIRRVQRFALDGLGSTFGATWPGWDGRVQPEPGPERDLETCAAGFPLLELALPAAREACGDAALGRAVEEGTYDRSNIAVVVGTCFGQAYREFHEIGEWLAARLGFSGPRITISTACASSANALGLGRDLIATGRADVVLAGGVDVLLREAFAGFSSLGVLSPEPCAPFSTPLGTTLGEGAGFVILERADRARARGASASAGIYGYGLSADAFHETSPDPGGYGIGRAIRGALGDAGWSPDTVDYVSAHATGTPSNDPTEWAAIKRELGSEVLVSAPKSMLGHTQGASGALELILSVLAMRRDGVPPTLNFRGARPGCPPDPAAGTGLRPHTVRRALKLTAAFGGANAVVAYGPVEDPPRARAPAGEGLRQPAVVILKSASVIGPRGFASTSEQILESGLQKGAIPEFRFTDAVRNIDPRRLDRSSRHLIAVASRCLEGAAVKLRGDAKDRAGLFVAATRMPEESARKCKNSVRYKGAAGTSAAAFAHMSVNAPTGACAKALSLRGPSSTLSIGEGSGLLSIVLAADWLATRSDADFIVAGSIDEVNPAGSDTEAAACALLARREAHAPPDTGEVRVLGWGIAGPDSIDRAVAQALGERGPPDIVVSDGEVEPLMLPGSMRDIDRDHFIDVSTVWGRAEGTRSAVAVALAAAYLAEGRARSALVVGVKSRSSATALLLSRY